MSIIFIVSDTLRRDRVGCYGNGWIRTPHLDRFARQCVIFDRCYEASFPTIPTRADWFTGKFTCPYLGWAPLPPDELTLPALLLLDAMEGERVELSHVASDPQQKRNVFRQNRKVAEGLHQKFVALLEESGTEERLLAPRRRLKD